MAQTIHDKSLQSHPVVSMIRFYSSAVWAHGVLLSSRSFSLSVCLCVHTFNHHSISSMHRKRVWRVSTHYCINA